MNDVFISHSSADDAFVRELQQALGDHGVSAWIDSRELLPGGLLEADIQTAIEAAAAFAVVVSPQSLQSKWVGKEMRRALEVQKERLKGTFPVIPLSLDGTKLGVLEEFFDCEPIYIPVGSKAGGIESAMNAHRQNAQLYRPRGRQRRRPRTRSQTEIAQARDPRPVRGSGDLTE